MCVNRYPSSDRCAATVFLKEWPRCVVVAGEARSQRRRGVQVNSVHDTAAHIANVGGLGGEAPPQIALEGYVP